MKRGRVPKTRPGWGGALASDSCAFISDVTRAVEAKVTAIGRLDDQDGRET